ncbi:MAG: BldC family transcriptional regulator [Cellulomonadaceae bacterium]|nr:BldC family transcriptional regulator [Cellulomonadaceae bacterium]
MSTQSPPAAARTAAQRTAAIVGVEPLLTPTEVAEMFRVDAKTVTRWANAGKITTVRTLGGHRRYSEREIRTLLVGVPAQRPLDR